MPINFTRILQDSWNFIRNQRRFTLYFMLAFIGLLAAFQIIIDTVQPGILKEVSAHLDAVRQSLPVEVGRQLEESDPNNSLLLSVAVMQHPTMLTIFVTGQLATGFITVCGIIIVDQISRRKNFKFPTALFTAIRYFPGALAIDLLVLFPLVYGLVMTFFGRSLGWLLTIGGMYLFVRLCLAYIVYLTERKTIIEAVRFTWLKTQKGFGSLFIFCLLNYLVLSVLNGQISAWADNSALLLISVAITSFLHLFSIVFSYRFYTQFMK